MSEMDKLKADRDLLKDVERQIKKFQPTINEYTKLVEKKHKLVKSIDVREKSIQLALLTQLTQFKECDYPSMGVQAVSGTAYFDNNRIANELMDCLVKTATYEYGYKLEWTGPGFYDVIPTYSYDHSNDLIYTATFKKRQDV